MGGTDKKMSFKRLWKMVFEVIDLSSDGSAFHAGIARSNHERTVVSAGALFRFMTKSPRLVDRNRSSV